MNRLISTLCLLLYSLALMAQSADHSTFRIAFYNVENLFDLVDDPLTNDDDFTPEGRQKWTAERYQTKLDRIGEVISGMEFPTLIGLCEVENAKVLRDLCRSDNLSRNDYEFVHFDSPDYRGIDVALMYQKSNFAVLSSETIEIDFPLEVTPDIPDYTTREVLVVQGILNKKDTLHVIVTHFPSRRGGLKASEPKRLFVASQIRPKVDEIFAKNPNAHIILMGDFNDETDNKSITETLAVKPLNGTPPLPAQLYNCFSSHDEKELGSYNYRGNWNMLDQIILSSSMVSGMCPSFQQSVIYQVEKMMYEDEKYGSRPSRTYGGPNYYGGYSDHLPVFIEMKCDN